MDRLSVDRLIDYVDGAITREEHSAIEHAITQDRRANEVVVRLRDMKRLLGDALEMPRAPMFAETVRQRLRRAHAPNASRRKRALPHMRPFLGAVGALATVGFVSVFLHARGQESFFLARGLDTNVPDRRVGVEVFAHPRGASKASRMVSDGSSVSCEDGLSFIVYNRGHRAHGLSMFALDARGDLHWFYPSGSEGDRTSVSLPPALEMFPLPEGVMLRDVAPGPLLVVAVFSKEETTIDVLERAVRGEGLARLARDRRLVIQTTNLAVKE